MSKRVRVFAPATVANLACGFDVLGLAIAKPGDEVEMWRTEHAGVRLVQITGDEGKLPITNNTAVVAVEAMLKHAGITNVGFEFILHKNMPLGSGLGSSAASAAAALVAANFLLNDPYTRKQLVQFAVEGERAACGSAHADNVAPSLMGGIVLIRSYEPLDVITIPAPHDLYVAVAHPHYELRTEDSRAVLPRTINLDVATKQWGNLAGLICGLSTANYDLIARSMHDVIAEPYRAPLIPAFYDVKMAALSSGALACSISGSGPSVFALCKGTEIAGSIANAMQFAFEAKGLESDLFVSAINNQGASIIEHS